MSTPDFFYEEVFWEQGFQVVGADEVGRGALAGPVVAAAVVFAPRQKIEVEINDSKKLSSKKREIADSWIRQSAYGYAIGQASVSEIDKLGIVKATNRAFRRAILALEADRLLVDGFHIPNLSKFPRQKQQRLIKGDQLSLSIAAASILAKVYRDQQMSQLSCDSAFSYYGWHKNKGYATVLHRSAIRRYGVSPLHRSVFVRKVLQ